MAFELLSPELALVDPLLGQQARACLPSVEEQTLRPEPPGDDRHRATNDDAALRRLVELSDAEPPGSQPHLRQAKRVGAWATWIAALLLVEQTHLYSVLFH